MVKKKKTEKAIEAEKKKKSSGAKKIPQTKTGKAKKVESLKVSKKKEVENKEKKSIPALIKDSKKNYFYAIGRRKSSVAQVKIYPVASQEVKFEINHKEISTYFPLKKLQFIALSPLTLTGQEGKFKVLVKASGGGISGQAQAISLGLARALVLFDQELRRSLKDTGLLRRDSRKVERKKPGLKKARRSPQWAKR